MLLNQDFRDILSEFIAAEVEFLVVGAYALAAHGVPRATGDIDIWINSSPENAHKVWSALKSFGAPLDDVSQEDFAHPGITYQMGLPPHRIDVLTQVDGVTFHEGLANQITPEIDGLRIPVIGLDALIRNKQTVRRPKDLVDAELLLAKKNQD